MAELLQGLQIALGHAYRVERELTRGGMSRLFLATEASLNRQVVVKVLPPEFTSEVSAERFKQEIAVAAHLQHPNILPVLAAGAKDDLLYYVMPYVAGESLRHRLSREGKLPVRDAVQILTEVADALALAHVHGVIHRDIKPENILLQGGHAVLADFGVARALLEARSGGRLTETGWVVGTPGYMSPEQAAGEKHIDASADVYALAVVGYEMLTGRPPFEGPTAQALLVAHLSQPPKPLRAVRLDTPAAIETAIARALSKTPAERFRSAADFRDALFTTPRPGLTRRAVAWVGIAALLLLVAAFVLYQRRGPANLTSVKGPVRLVVLPFDNLGRAEDDYFADGMTEAITSRLAQLSGLAVIARTSALQYKHTSKLPKQIGDELRVQYLLEGSISWEKEANGSSRVRINPQLIRVADATHVWAQPYEDALSGVFKLQADIAERVAQSMNVTLLQPERQRLEEKPTENLEAYDLFLRGNERSGVFTETNVRSAIDLYQRAVKLDPKFAVAYRRLSWAHAFLYNGFEQTPKRLTLAREAADRAMQLRPDEGHLALAGYYFFLKDNAAALEQLKIADSLQPNQSEVSAFTGQAYIALGDWTHAVSYLESAVDRDPRSEVLTWTLGAAQDQLFRFASAVRSFDRAIVLDPSDPSAHFMKVETLLVLKGRGSETQAAAARALQSLGADRFLNVFLSTTVGWHFMLILSADPRVRETLERVRLGSGGFDSAAYYVTKAVVYRSLDDLARGRAYADSARGLLEARVRQAPGSPLAHGGLGVSYAVLGMKEPAIREGRQAVALNTSAQQAPDWLLNLGLIYAMVGEREDAIETLAKATDTLPGNYTRTYLRADPTLAPLLDDPRLRILPLPGEKK